MSSCLRSAEQILAAFRQFTSASVKLQVVVPSEYVGEEP
jgi:hypothetical protein